MLHLETIFGGRQIPYIPPQKMHNLGIIPFISDLTFWIHNDGCKGFTVQQVKVISNPHGVVYYNPDFNIQGKCIMPFTAKRFVISCRKRGYVEFQILITNDEGEEYDYFFKCYLVEY